MNTFKFGDMCKCPECKKEFFVSNKDAWAYKKEHKGRRLIFCTYGCMRSWEKSVK